MMYSAVFDYLMSNIVLYHVMLFVFALCSATSSCMSFYSKLVEAVGGVGGQV